MAHVFAPNAVVSVPIAMNSSLVPSTVTAYDSWFNGTLIPSDSPFWTYATSADKITVVSAATGLEVPRFIENFSYADKAFCLWIGGGAAKGRTFYVQAGPSVSKVNAASVFTDAGATTRHGFNEASGALIDSAGNYNGTGANLESYGNAAALCKSVAFNGNNSIVDIGDVTQLNSVNKFTIAMLYTHDNIAAFDILFKKTASATSKIQAYVYTDNRLYLEVATVADVNGSIAYNTIAQNGVPQLLIWVYDGTLANENRHKLYFQGQSRSVTMSGAIPTAAPNLAGVAASYGATANSLDGKLDEARVMAGYAMSADEALLRYNNWLGESFWSLDTAIRKPSSSSRGGTGLGISIGIGL